MWQGRAAVLIGFDPQYAGKAQDKHHFVSIVVEVQVSAYIVAELLAAAEAFTGASVRKAVISV